MAPGQSSALQGHRQARIQNFFRFFCVEMSDYGDTQPRGPIEAMEKGKIQKSQKPDLLRMSLFRTPTMKKYIKFWTFNTRRNFMLRAF